MFAALLCQAFSAQGCWNDAGVFLPEPSLAARALFSLTDVLVVGEPLSTLPLSKRYMNAQVSKPCSSQHVRAHHWKPCSNCAVSPWLWLWSNSVQSLIGILKIENIGKPSRTEVWQQHFLHFEKYVYMGNDQNTTLDQIVVHRSLLKWVYTDQPVAVIQQVSCAWPGNRKNMQSGIRQWNGKLTFKDDLPINTCYCPSLSTYHPRVTCKEVKYISPLHGDYSTYHVSWTQRPPYQVK